MARTYRLDGPTAIPTGEADDLKAASALLPAGAYSTLRTYGGDGVVRLADHVRRLEQSVSVQGRSSRLDVGDVRAALAEVLRRAGHPECRLRLTFAPPDLFATVEPFVPPPAELYANGAWCVTVPVRREAPQAKDTRFVSAAAEAYRRLPPGAHEGLLVGDDGAILEGLSSNAFALAGGVLRTEGARALGGITRALVLELADGRVPVSLSPLRKDEVGAAQEWFLTSASREVLPVVRIDGTTIGDGRPGPFASDLRARFRERMRAEADHLLAG